MESVRYAARLDTGEGFLAFAGGYLVTPEPHLEVGEVELPEGRILGYGSDVPGFLRVKRSIPIPVEHVYIVALENVPSDALQATDLGNGDALVVIDRTLPDHKWGGRVTEYAWDRTAYIEVAMA